MRKGPVLPVAPRCFEAEERDRDLPLEGAGGVVVEEVPVADDAVPAVFEERGPGDAVGLLCINGAEGGEQVPEVVVLPDREREDVVDMHRFRRGDGPPRPDAGERPLFLEDRAVDVPCIRDRPLGRRGLREQREHALLGDGPGLVRGRGELGPLLQEALLPGDEPPEVLKDRAEVAGEGEPAGVLDQGGPVDRALPGDAVLPVVVEDGVVLL